MHRLTAGAGYRYLLRHIATGDCQRTGADPVTAYYTESGNPPGRWIGRGLAGLGASSEDDAGPGVAAGSPVEERGMARMYGHGHDPVTDVALGRPYPHISSAADRVAAATKALPAGMPREARAAAVETIMRVGLAK
ncbi:MAG TPA: relaxase domain-containing protein, partial [Propionicimonas sp.]